jgi:hypothetical protein
LGLLTLEQEGNRIVFRTEGERVQEKASDWESECPLRYDVSFLGDSI